MVRFRLGSRRIMYNKYLHYGLDESFIYLTGSDAALSAAMTAAYEKGELIA